MRWPHTKKENIHKMNTGTHTSTPTNKSAETPDGNEYFPPCRLAEVFITTCPRCGREMRLKTLRYTHKCGRSFDPVQRAREQQAAANNAIKVRIDSMKQPMEHGVQHTTTNLDKKQVC